MEVSTTWLLVADASKASLYSMHKALLFQEQQHPNHLKLIEYFSHDKSRKKASDLITDRWGEYGHATFEAASPKVHEAEIFALQLLERLETGRIEKNFRDIIIIAPPNFMGLLNKHMSTTIAKLVSQQIEKNYTQKNERELIENLLAFI